MKMGIPVNSPYGQIHNCLPTISITLPETSIGRYSENHHRTMFVYNENARPKWHNEDYQVIEGFRDQNSLRHAISILLRCGWSHNGRMPIVQIHDLSLTYDERNRTYRLWVHAPNWPGRAGMLYGIILGHKLFTKKRSKNRDRKAQADNQVSSYCI